MDRLTAFVATAANFGRWARDLLVLGMTTPLAPSEANAERITDSAVQIHPLTGLLVLTPGFDTHGNAVGYIPPDAEVTHR